MPKKSPIICTIQGKSVVTEDSNPARELFNKSRFGIMKSGKVILSLLEGLFLLEKEKIIILNGKNKEMTVESFIKRSKKEEPNMPIRYPVFRDLRDRGYIVKTALKFGADFRVYDRGIKPGEDHAKWVVFAVHESEKMTWFDFSAKSRVAHSTRKNLLIGIVDAEEDVTYYENKWVKP